MMSDLGKESTLKERTAIEALRAGVPNRAAIRELKTSAGALLDIFVSKLEDGRTGLTNGQETKGLIVSGGFGSGKSHLLGLMQEFALERRFVVSFVPVSKETPLFQPAKLYEAAVRNAFVPSTGGNVVNDDLMTEVLRRLASDANAYDDLEHWASDPRNGLSPLFAALLHLIPKQQLNPENVAEIARFFGGARIATPNVRLWLRLAGAAKLFNIKQPRVAELAVQRLRFAPRLFRAAGYAGWCILLDETELIGRYSVLQRGKSYAELCRWLGLSDKVRVPGIVSVCAITDDFVDEVINNKRDDELVPQRLEAKGLIQEAELAKIAMRTLEAEKLALSPPSETTLRDSLMRVSELYRKAYNWVPPETNIGQRLSGRTMRQYIKSWITAWDIERLYGERPEIAMESLEMNYAENTDFERAPENDEPAEGDG
jgi:hypothetical protein